MNIIMAIYTTGQIALFMALALVALVLILLLLNWLAHLKVNAVERRNGELQDIMEQALSMGEYYTVRYSIKNKRWDNTHGALISPKGMTMDEIMNQLHPDDREQMGAIVKRLLKGEESQSELNFRWRYVADNDKEDKWIYAHGQMAVEYGDNGRPASLISIAKNVTPDVEDEYADDVLLKRLHKIFDTSLVAMSFYDKDGRLVDINQNMRKIIGDDKTAEDYFKNTPLTDIDFIKNDFSLERHDQLHICHHMYYPSFGMDKYLEMHFDPIFDDNGNLAYYCITAREITGEREMYLEQLQHDRQLHEADKAISKYEKELEHLLTDNQMFICSTDFATKTISFSKSLRKMDFTQNLEDYMGQMFDEDKSQAALFFNDAKCMSQPYNAIRHFRYTPTVNEPSWHAFTSMPVFGSNGQLIGQFGVKRDITRLMEAQEKLKYETAFADESGKLKSVFLANMTHEIRTPLNAIVGFSGLLQFADNSDERREFIRIIRNNCGMLLRLINDILEASNMGQALSIEPEDIDFAQVFDDICPILAQRVQEPGVEFQKDNPYSVFRTCVDKGRLQQVFTNFVTNAVKYTHEGHIRIGYRAEVREENGERRDGLYIYCEDTGAGIPHDKQSSVFERFVKLNDTVQGTGLGLSICKAIAERCGGVIGVHSDGPGHGSTFWMWIPCLTDYKEKEHNETSKDNADK